MDKASIIETDSGEIRLRPFNERDVSAQLDYLYESPAAFLEGIGFDLAKLPGRLAHQKILEESLKTDEGAFFRVVAELAGKSIALVVLERGEDPRAHFHILRPEYRGKGYGALIFKRGIRMLMEYHGHEVIHVEPKADNEPMNRLMLKCGFDLIGDSFYESRATYRFASKKYVIRLSDLREVDK